MFFFWHPILEGTQLENLDCILDQFHSVSGPPQRWMVWPWAVQHEFQMQQELMFNPRSGTNQDIYTWIHLHPHASIWQFNTIYLLLYAHQCKHMCIRISILSLLYDIVKSELDLLFVAHLSAGVKQRNSGLGAWASTQLQAADLGTASRLRYFRQSIGSREHLPSGELT